MLNLLEILLSKFSINNIKKNKIFFFKASSYQLEYSKLFKSKFAVILNIFPDHLERHKTIKNYISAKFRLIKNQGKDSTVFINKHNKYIKKKIKKNKYKSKIIKVDTKFKKKFINLDSNEYFASSSNRENLSFVIEIAKKFNVKKSNLIKTIIHSRV